MCLFGVVSTRVFDCRSKKSFANGLLLRVCLSLSITIFGAPSQSHFRIVSKVVLLRFSFWCRIIFPCIFNTPCQLLTRSWLWRQHWRRTLRLLTCSLAVGCPPDSSYCRIRLQYGQRPAVWTSSSMISMSARQRQHCLFFFRCNKNISGERRPRPQIRMLRRFPPLKRRPLFRNVSVSLANPFFSWECALRGKTNMRDTGGCCPPYVKICAGDMSSFLGTYRREC